MLFSIHLITGSDLDKKLKEPERNCIKTNVGGFLKEVCFNASNDQYYHVCANSMRSYEQNDRFDSKTGGYTLSSVSHVCQNDPHVYQACGFSLNITKNSPFLCGGYFSPDTEHAEKKFVECQGNTCNDSIHCKPLRLVNVCFLNSVSKME